MKIKWSKRGKDPSSPSENGGRSIGRRLDAIIGVSKTTLHRIVGFYVFNNPLDTGWMHGRESANVKAIRIELFDLSRRL